MLIWIIISIFMIVIASLLTVYVTYYNKFQIAIIKISEAENYIDTALNKRLNLFIRVNNILKEKDEKSMLDGLEKLERSKLNNFELNKKLNSFNKNLNELIDFNKDIEFDKTEIELLNELVQINLECEASEKYYNDNVIIYNKLIRCFPSNIIGKLCRYDIKDFYSNEKEEIFEILKK